jgi:hypothetical protein
VLATLRSRHHAASADGRPSTKPVRVVCAGRLRAKHISSSTRERNNWDYMTTSSTRPVLKGGAGAGFRG